MCGKTWDNPGYFGDHQGILGTTEELLFQDLSCYSLLIPVLLRALPMPQSTAML